MRILIADDEKDIRELLTTVFRLNGWEVLEASNGREALYLYHQSIHQGRVVDVLVLDVQMAELGGFAVGVNVRNLETFGDVPRAVHIYLTGHKDVVPPQNLIDSLFADAYIRKPFEVDELVKTIEKLVSERKMNAG